MTKNLLLLLLHFFLCREYSEFTFLPGFKIKLYLLKDICRGLFSNILHLRKVSQE